MTATAVDLPPSPPIIPGLTVWFQSLNPGAQPIYASAGTLQTPVYWQYLGSPHDHTPALDAEFATLTAYIAADNVYALNSNSGSTTFGNDGPVITPTSLAAPIHAAVPAIQQAVVAIAAQAVQLPAGHSFFAFAESILAPIVRQFAVAEVSALVAKIPGGTP